MRGRLRCEHTRPPAAPREDKEGGTAFRVLMTIQMPRWRTVDLQARYAQFAHIGRPRCAVIEQATLPEEADTICLPLAADVRLRLLRGTMTTKPCPPTHTFRSAT